MYTISSHLTKPFMVMVTINGRMEVDTGASISIMAEEVFRPLREEGITLNPTSAMLFTYTAESIPVVWSTEMRVEHHGQAATLPLIVTRGQGPPLLGKDWLSALKLIGTRFSQYTLTLLYKMCWTLTLRYSKMDSERSKESLPRFTLIRIPLHSCTELGHSPKPYEGRSRRSSNVCSDKR